MLAIQPVSSSVCQELSDFKEELKAFSARLSSLVSQFGEDLKTLDSDNFYKAFYDFLVSFKARATRLYCIK